MTPDIPEDQLTRIRPLVDQLLTDLRALSAKLPDETESATDYSLAAENQ